MRPSELLVRAADLVRDTAVAATPGPWETIGDAGGIWREASPERAVRTSPGYLGSMDAAENARWIALASPAVAPHLEAWLRSTASRLEAWLPTGWPIRQDEAAAIRFALAVLGMTVEEAEAFLPGGDT